jgi:PRC-barrel domain
MLQTDYVSNNHIKELHSSEFEMAKGEPDIRNWKVIGLQNQEVGKVSELLFDEVSNRVRYLVVIINGKPLNLISRSVLVPVGLAELLREEKVVLLSGLNITHLASLPTYEKGKISRDTEFAIREVFSPANGLAYQNDDIEDKDAFYNHEHFNDERSSRSGVQMAKKNALKEEIKENMERVKESVRKMENEVDKLDKSGLRD